MINQQGNVREIVPAIISNKNVEALKPLAKKPRILMIDEVDVFFSKDFHGNVYTPACRLQRPEITALIDMIWAHRTEKISWR